MYKKSRLKGSVWVFTAHHVFNIGHDGSEYRKRKAEEVQFSLFVILT